MKSFDIENTKFGESLRLVPQKQWAMVVIGILGLIYVSYSLFFNCNNCSISWLVLLALFFCLVSVYSMSLPYTSFLQLDSNGFTVKHLGKRLDSYKWNDIDNFGITKDQDGRIIVGFNYRQNSNICNKISIQINTSFNNLGFITFESYIPNYYGNNISPEKLVILMNRWLQESRLKE